MVQASGVRVPAGEAEATRRRLRGLGVLRDDLRVARDGEDVLFPVVDSCGPKIRTELFAFEGKRGRGPGRYEELLDWPESLRAKAPRAYDRLGDIIVVKVPDDLMGRAAEIGAALAAFHDARAVFHDRGVVGEFRTRDLVRIAGEGDAVTQVQEHGVRLWVDPSRAYYSPRLATERARVVAGLAPGDRLVDLFGGVAPLGVQAGRAGLEVDSVDLNPDAVALARRNVEANGVAGCVDLWEGDARVVAAKLRPAHAVFMNLPHGAAAFLDAAVPLVLPGGVLHLHEIVAEDAVAVRAAELVAAVAALGRVAVVEATHTVRQYAAGIVHVAFDLRLQ